jgi:hypothetical protein
MKLTDLFKKFWLVAPLPVTTYGTKYLDPFMNVSWDFSKQAPILISVYGDMFGGASGSTIVTGSWFVMVIVMYWLRQEDVAVPMFMTCILATIAFFTTGIIPEEWKPFMALVFVGIPAGALFYTWILTRQT